MSDVCRAKLTSRIIYTVEFAANHSRLSNFVRSLPPLLCSLPHGSVIPLLKTKGQQDNTSSLNVQQFCFFQAFGKLNNLPFMSRIRYVQKIKVRICYVVYLKLTSFFFWVFASDMAILLFYLFQFYSSV